MRCKKGCSDKSAASMRTRADSFGSRRLQFAFPSLSRPSEKRSDLFYDKVESGCSTVCVDDHDEIESNVENIGLIPDGFTEATLGAIPLRSVADLFGGSDSNQPGSRQSHDSGQRSACATSGREDRFEPCFGRAA
jgi:hypothetical protein